MRRTLSRVRRCAAARSGVIMACSGETAMAWEQCSRCSIKLAVALSSSPVMAWNKITQLDQPPLVEECLRLFQIERVEALRKPAVDRSEQDRGLHPACPERARAAPYSSPCAVPRTCLLRTRNLIDIALPAGTARSGQERAAQGSRQGG